jgi:hypothetical protein
LSFPRVNIFSSNKICNEVRLKELDDYKDDAKFVEEEKSQLRDKSKFSFLIDYLKDPWYILSIFICVFNQ